MQSQSDPRVANTLKWYDKDGTITRRHPGSKLLRARICFPSELLPPELHGCPQPTPDLIQPRHALLHGRGLSQQVVDRSMSAAQRRMPVQLPQTAQME